MNSQIQVGKTLSVKFEHFNPIERRNCRGLTPKVDQLKANFKTSAFNSEDIIKQISICGWRSKTYLPIIKIINYSISMLNPPNGPVSIINIEINSIINASKIKYNNEYEEKAVSFIQNNSREATYELKIQVEQIKYQLKDLGKLPFSQVIYLIKELLIGFEVLIDIFDLFEPNQGMVVVNGFSQWKIWIDEDYYLNSNKQPKNINLKQFIKRLLTMAQNHCMVSQQAKSFFSIISNLQNTNQYNFIRILQKINEFVATNKLFQVHKVMIPPNSIIKKDQEKLRKQSKKQVFIPEKKSYKEIKNLGNRSYTNIPQSSVYFVPPKKYPANKINNHDNNLSINPRRISYNCPNDFSNSFKVHQKPSKHKKQDEQMKAYSYEKKQILKSKFNRTSINQQMKTSISISPSKIQRLNSPQSKNNPFLCQKKRNTLKIQNQSFFQSQICQRSKSFKILKVRKFSQDNRVIQNRLIISREPKKSYFKQQKRTSIQAKQEQSFYSYAKKWQQKKIVSCHEIENFSTPNNSSSTKQIQKESELESTYSKLKLNDLGYKNKQKQNHSFVNSFLHNNADDRAKNMTVSHQFPNKKDAQRQRQGQQQMKYGNKIVEGQTFDLFADNMSIRNVNSSVILDKDEQFFEKAHLKDVKLDLLEKFGRNVNHIVEQDDQSLDTRRNKNQLMQLIEEEVDEGKSFFEQNRTQKSRNLQFSQEMPKNSQLNKLCLFVSDQTRQPQHNLKKTTNNTNLVMIQNEICQPSGNTNIY